MGWLQKRVQVADGAGLYTLGQNKNILLVGLGNPGKDYDLTRHNVGFYCLDQFVAKTDAMSDWIVKKDLKCQQSTGQLGDTRVIAIKPTTFMNLSGEAVQAAAAFYKISDQNIVVLHDELDIDFGQIRLRMGGSSAGHNGLKSIIKYFGEDFGRLRIGVGPKSAGQRTAKTDGAGFVLKKFSKKEQADLPSLSREVNAILSEYIYSGQLPHETRSFLV
ncbi:MAG TPA: aminoacyl-tRNA hydrolase [Patescibacteria group bacterium]|nr:aminoacyl-tRNA hydrolase [Patescibacteria group bacterium]